MRIRWRRWHHDVFPAAQPKNHGGDEHEQARNAEGDSRPELSQKNWHQERREERTKVDDPIKGIEDDLRAVLVSLIELIADKCRDTRFDSTRPKRDQPESDVKSGAIVHEHRETRLTDAVDQAQ